MAGYIVPTSVIAVKNHGIPEEIIESAISTSKEFFSLPIDKKMEASTTKKQLFHQSLRRYAD
jgi:isopenicillin N synthase-like dioxygenase